MNPPSARTAAFEWSREEIVRVGRRVAELIADHLTGLPGAPAFSPMPAARAAALRRTAFPDEGLSVDEILDAFARDVSPFPFGNGHPRFFAWVNSPPAVAGIFAEALAAAMNPSVAGGNHAAVHLEHGVIRWFADLIGFPAAAHGLMVSGTSAAALVALGAARHAACASVSWDVRGEGLQVDRVGRARPPLVMYTSAEGHSCHQKAAELLGVGTAHIRTVPTDRRRRIDPIALERLIAADRRAGTLPMAVVATAGTVNTGAIDPLSEIAEVCVRHAVWLHVDGAYGAPATLLDEYRDALAALASADSVALDPHKWLYVPVDAGVVLVRDAARLREAFSLVPPYLRTDGDAEGVQGPPWFSEFGIEQTRPFRALKVWMTLQAFGRDGYRAMLRHDVALARYLADRVRSDARLVLWEPPEMSIVCFRSDDPRWSGEANDAVNRRVLRAMQLGGIAFLSSTVMDGRLWLRACVVNPRATSSDIDALFSAVISALDGPARD